MDTGFKTTAELAARLTRQASRQTFFTIRFLVDRERAADAYRSYAYFRWVDDSLDQRLQCASERSAFLARQQALIEDVYQGRTTACACIEEQMLIHLVQGNADACGALARYIRNLMAVMAFDAERRGRLITQAELETYTHSLAVAITEGLHYFLGRAGTPPVAEARYLSVTGAHVAHMLRDTWDDNRAGYFNIPLEVLEADRMSPFDVRSQPYREWVRSRISWARKCFCAGRRYIARYESAKFRIAAHAYVARFAGILASIERNGCMLQPAYQERRSVQGALEFGWSALSSAFTDSMPTEEPRILSAR